jgi:hypothetical protein
MAIRKMLSVLIAAALLPAAAQAQSRHGWGDKTVRGGAAGQAAGESQNGEPGDRNALEGTWRATESFGPGGTFKVLFSFHAGRDGNGGTSSHSDELFFTAAPSCLPAQGVWKRTGDRTFVATDEGFCFDTFGGFAPAGAIKFKSAITLNAQGTAFDGTLHVEGFDAGGNLVFTTDADLHGERMRAEAP